MDFGTLTAKDFAEIFARTAGVSAEMLLSTPEANADMEKHLAAIKSKMKEVKLTFEFVLNQDNSLEVKNGSLLPLLVGNKDVAPVPFDDIESVLMSLQDIYEGRFCSQVGAVMVSLLM